MQHGSGRHWIRIGRPWRLAAGAAPSWLAIATLLQQVCRLLDWHSGAEGGHAGSSYLGVHTRCRLNPLPPMPSPLHADEQLYKDVESVLGECFLAGLIALAQQQQQLDGSGATAEPLCDPDLLVPLLLLWDGICHLFAGRPKPSGWVATVLRAAKLFSAEAREAAAAAVEGRVTSQPLVAAQRLWRDLKSAQLKPLFEMADVVGDGGGGSLEEGGGRAAKRRQ